jgi:MFS family permease
MTVVPGDAADDDAPEHVGIPPASPGYRRYALWLLMIIYMLNFLDRSVINILAEDIKRELHLTDAQVGLMSGLAFALFYTFLGIGIARLAERFSRPWILAGSLALWSGFTALSGFVQNFTQMFIARLGVGFGEAGCTPAAHSLIADDNPKERRASALAFYAMGTPLGALLGLAMGGVVADAYGWRMAFLVAGIPGLLFALVAGFTLKEPRQRLAAGARQVTVAGASFADTMRTLARKRTFWLVAFGASISAFIGYGQGPFTAPFFLRVHGQEIAALAPQFGLQSLGFIGLTTGIIGGLAGAAGSMLGGVIADRVGVSDLRNVMMVPVVAGLIWMPLGALIFLVPSASLALLILAVPSVLGTLWYGPVYSTVQGVVPANMRATAAAILLFIINIIGLGLGPYAVGLLSDLLANAMRLGPAEGVRWALVASCAFAIPSVALTFLARTTIREDMES